MRNRIAALLKVHPRRVNVKATTTESLGFLGRAEGIAAQAIVLLLEAGEAAATQRDKST
jgi:2-C-methyl-D-erythritol 2,4-cyclodiphosphate synthase